MNLQPTTYKLQAAKIVFILISIALAVEGYVLLQTYLNPAKKYTGEMEKITVGVEKSLLPALVWIAESKGYFVENGVDVTIKEYDSGRAALTAMLSQGGLPAEALAKEGVDMVTVAQTPVMFNSFTRSDFAIVSAMVSSYNDVFVLARRDRGIAKPGDLRGKKIGLTKGSTGQYFLGLFLSTNSIQPSEVEEVDIPAGKLAESVTAGAVDAISVWQPHIYNAQKALGDKSVVFPTRKIFREDFYFVPNKNFLQNHPETITRFLVALKQAEEFIQKDTKDKDQAPDEAVAIVAKRLGLDREFVASIWDDFQFGLFLDKTIIQTLEEEAKWAIQNKLTAKTAVPNYFDFISVDALRKAAPEKVLIGN